MQSRGLHEALKRLFGGVLLPIRSGPLQGVLWSVTVGLAFLIGRYEPEKTEALERAVRSGDVVLDIGAHVGYFTLLMSRKVGLDGKVFAFEPRELNRGFLLRHLRANHIYNVEVFPWSVGNQEGFVRFETRTGTGTGHVSGEGNVTVPMVSVDALVTAGTVPLPTFLKIDVEGGEMEVLEGARETIERAHPRMVLATHGAELDARCHAFLAARGYSLTDLEQRTGDREYLVLPSPA